MTTFYLDSSAITKLVIAEEGSSDMRALIVDASLVTSRVAVVEVAKAVARVAPDVDTAAVFEAIACIELDEDLARQAGTTGDPTLRALDAIHVASASLIADEIDAFITYDMRQAAAARSAGLRVRSPGETEA